MSDLILAASGLVLLIIVFALIAIYYYGTPSKVWAKQIEYLRANNNRLYAEVIHERLLRFDAENKVKQLLKERLK